MSEVFEGLRRIYSELGSIIISKSEKSCLRLGWNQWKNHIKIWGKHPSANGLLLLIGKGEVVEC